MSWFELKDYWHEIQESSASVSTPGLVAGQVAVATSGDTIAGYVGLTYDAVTGTLTSTGGLASGTTRIDPDTGLTGSAVLPFLNRPYDAIAVVATTVTAALAAITDATNAKRYLLYVPNGTYTESAIHLKNYIDVVGQSRTGTIITTADAGIDAVKLGGVEAMLANLTITHTTTGYAIHADTATAGTIDLSATTIVHNVTASGAAGIGAGLRGRQRLILSNSSFTGTTNYGVYLHNIVGPQAGPAYATLINVRAISVTSQALRWNNLNSGKTDLAMVVGGSFVGAGGVGGEDIAYGNGSGGVNEGYLSISPSTVYVTSSVTDASRVLSLPYMASWQVPVQPNTTQYSGAIKTSPTSTFDVTASGIIQTQVYVAPPTATNAGWFKVVNTGGSYFLAADNSAGNGIFSGSSAYAMVLGTTSNVPLRVFLNGAQRFAILPDGLITVTTGIGGSKTTAFTSASAVAVPIATVAVASNASTSGEVGFEIELSDGTDFSVLRGRFPYAATNKAGTVAVDAAPVIFGTTNVASALGGTIAATVTVTTGTNAFTLNVVPTWTVMTPTVKNINWRFDSTRAAATITPIP
jgi:hypothetical protein